MRGLEKNRMKRDTHTRKHTDGHRDSMKESAKGRFFENQLFRRKAEYSRSHEIEITNHILFHSACPVIYFCLLNRPVQSIAIGCDAHMSVCLCVCPPPRHSETVWNGDLWSKIILIFFVGGLLMDFHSVCACIPCRSLV